MLGSYRPLPCKKKHHHLPCSSISFPPLTEESYSLGFHWPLSFPAHFIQFLLRHLTAQLLWFYTDLCLPLNLLNFPCKTINLTRETHPEETPPASSHKIIYLQIAKIDLLKEIIMEKRSSIHANHDRPRLPLLSSPPSFLVQNFKSQRSFLNFWTDHFSSQLFSSHSETLLNLQ